MLRYYFKIAIRKLWRNKQSTLFNILGLCIGIACCILIALFIYDDFGYDRYNSNAKNIYKLITEVNENGSSKYGEGIPAPLKLVLQEEIPEIKYAVRFGRVQEYTTLLYGNKEFRDSKILLTDPEVFDLLDLKIIKGNPKSVLTELNSIVITNSYARKLFANEEPIGKVISLKGEPNSDFIITGVIDTLPAKSTIQFNCLCSFQLLNENRWGIWNFECFISVRENTNSKILESKFKPIEDKYLNNSDAKVKIHLQPLTRIHLDLNPLNKFPTAINNKPIFLFALIGLLILLIACFNYIILATTNASKRNIEVGIQKALGAGRWQLIIQFLGESVFITIVATYFGVLLAENYLPVLNQLSGKQISLHYNSNLAYLSLGTFSILLGVVSGLYPALFLSAFKPIGIFKSEFYSRLSAKKNIFRQYLITIQFIISIALIISTITIKKQLAFVGAKDIGFDYHNILVLSIHPREVREKYPVFTENLLRYPRILNVSETSYLPGEWGFNQSTWLEGMPPDSYSAMMDWMSVDTNFLKTLKIKIVKGSDFVKGSPNERQYILNRSAVQEIGWSNPLGKRMDIIGKGEVIGIVEDFNFKSLHTNVSPLALCVYPQVYEYLYVRIQADSIPSTIHYIQNEWNKLFPQIEFTYSFLDTHIEKNYNAEVRTGMIINYFSLIAILLSCLGIYSLVSYTTQQRTKEVGIRKVTGAKTIEIMLMLSGDFTKWVAIAFAFACPISYFAMNKWLQNFAYKTHLSWWIFMVAGLIAFIIALATMSWQSWKAANKNPVEALRYE